MKALLALLLFLSTSVFSSEKHLALGYKYLLQNKKEKAKKSLVYAFENTENNRILARTSYLLTMTKFKLSSEDQSYFALNALKYNKGLKKTQYEALQRKSADILFRSGKLNRALKLFNTLINKTDDFSLKEYSVYKKGWILVNQGKYIELIKLWNSWLTKNNKGDLREIIANDLGKFIAEAVYLDKILRISLPKYNYETLIFISKGLNGGYRKYQTRTPYKLLKLIKDQDLFESSLSLILENNIYYKAKACEVTIPIRRVSQKYPLHYGSDSLMKYLKLCAKKQPNNRELIAALSHVDFNEKDSYEKALILVGIEPGNSVGCELFKAHLLEVDEPNARFEFVKAFVNYCPNYSWNPHPYELEKLESILIQSKDSSLRLSLLNFYSSRDEQIKVIKTTPLNSRELSLLISKNKDLVNVEALIQAFGAERVNKDVVHSFLPVLTQSLKENKTNEVYSFTNKYINSRNLDFNSAKLLYVLSKKGKSHQSITANEITKALSSSKSDSTATKLYLASLLDSKDLATIVSGYPKYKRQLTQDRVLFRSFIELYLTTESKFNSKSYIFKYLNKARNGKALGSTPKELKSQKELLKDIKTYNLCAKFSTEAKKAKLSPKFLSRIFKRIDYRRKRVANHLWSFELLLKKSNENLSKSIETLASRLQKHKSLSPEIKEMLLTKLNERRVNI